MFERIRRFLTDLIGRKHLGCKASIPAPLEGAFELWPEGDRDLVLLTQYDPQPFRVTIPESATYSATLEALVRGPAAPASSTVNVDQLREILSLSPKPRYEDL